MATTAMFPPLVNDARLARITMILLSVFAVGISLTLIAMFVRMTR